MLRGNIPFNKKFTKDNLIDDNYTVSSFLSEKR